MWANRNFRIINLCLALITAPYNMFGPIVSLLLEPFGISVFRISLFGGLSVLAGVVGSIMAGLFIDRTRAYKKSLVFLSAVPILAVTIFRWFLPMGPDYFDYVLIAGMIFTAAVMGAMVLCNSFAVEVTYPIEPAMI